ncbi:MAG: GGDEF domain-containing protein [Rhodospirillales bacterium]|jgi:diguanylate cyclase (GGDEF)-like protein|nr:GGDEF domain-containing protein [Rhodospirillales bacterium]MBT4005908.1 GGDEF domain-containing protein [Rhodospirillales bacterium]MBT5077255.1 GGDEF domain-containing protein [Rhodospirillales bacterium]MBT5113674.1 GGDEF domain-containing protein [Rhodospirillales bacterium]MBT5674013.1 GGDEF domain-containing protein [Rhodospirillales bacterium]
MRIGDSRPVRGTTGVARARGATPVGKDAGVAKTGAVGDTTSVLGIPEEEFTPKVRDAIMHLLEEVSALRQELQEGKARVSYLEKLADEDALVPVANRRAFVRELSRMLSFAQRYGGEVSVLYFDIDDMKQINDTLGHAGGDAAIMHIAKILSHGVRESDVVGRLGGDEFGAILVNASEKEAREKAESLAKAIAETPLNWNGQQVSMKISIGAYSLQGGEDASDMLEQADKAMYDKKSPTGRRA